MARRVSIGYQEFEDIIINDLFYVDKTQFINYPAAPLRKNTDNELDEYDTPMQEAWFCFLRKAGSDREITKRCFKNRRKNFSNF